MSSLNGDADGPKAALTVSEVDGRHTENKDMASKHTSCATVGATVPTGFEKTAASEVQEKIGSESRISKDRGRIYFDVPTENLYQVHLLRSVDNLFVVVQEFPHYQFDKSKESILEDFRRLAGQLPWTNPLEVWELNNSLKKRKFQRRKTNPGSSLVSGTLHESDKNDVAMSCAHLPCGDQLHNGTGLSVCESGPSGDQLSEVKESPFISNDEILLNIHDNEVVIGIALTEESLHRRNIVHFGPTTLRSTLAYGMLRLCSPQLTDVIVDPMCGTGAIPIEGALEFTHSYFLGGDNNELAVNRSINNINSLQKKRLDSGRVNWGLPLDVAQWDICNLPLKTSSVDVVISDMPFGKRIGSKRKNWDLYPACLKEMGRVCRPETGRAALLTQDKKCFVKAMSRMGHLWRKSHTVWVNVGGLHAAVYLLKRTSLSFNELFNRFQDSAHNKDVPCKEGTSE
ncbi:tRNA (guanine(6)-N2)-methyltransferase THUMP3 isoform X2 [Narcine bancroftii]|uniref:tRNA (guanine(6)-N2)-methyltransferase THUMP3 isoform X2 n=1 Tax=Narcine bancroftii TaxID=1343680 RepID=UPI0038317052